MCLEKGGEIELLKSNVNMWMDSILPETKSCVSSVSLRTHVSFAIPIYQKSFVMTFWKRVLQKVVSMYRLNAHQLLRLNLAVGLADRTRLSGRWKLRYIAPASHMQDLKITEVYLEYEVHISFARMSVKPRTTRLCKMLRLKEWNVWHLQNLLGQRVQHPSSFSSSGLKHAEIECARSWGGCFPHDAGSIQDTYRNLLNWAQSIDHDKL